ncbi:MAG TPA: NUDIX domain-containing protein [Opitutaceae bacterium]|nr:NUDIX domain-containing protein [Opitutaceae bacterium]
MPKESAGIVLYRIREPDTEFFLVHPGGPFWKNKDAGGWSIPKGEISAAEEPLAAAQREFFEETAHRLPGPFVPLGQIRLAGGKIVHAWATEGECDPAKIVSNSFEIEWPPRSGKMAQFPEIDRAGWFTLHEAEVKLHRGQAEFLKRLMELMKGEG